MKVTVTRMNVTIAVIPGEEMKIADNITAMKMKDGITATMIMIALMTRITRIKVHAANMAAVVMMSVSTLMIVTAFLPVMTEIMTVMITGQIAALISTKEAFTMIA